MINGSLQGLGAVTVGTLGTLGGSGSISGVHAPGNSAGLQSFGGNLSYNATGSMAWELFVNTEAGRGTTFDGVNVGGNLSVAGGSGLSLTFKGAGSTVDFTQTFWEADRAWLVFDVGAETTGSFSITALGLDSQGRSAAEFGAFSLSTQGSDVYLNWTAGAIPEPSTYAAMAGLMSMGVVTARRRRRG